MYSDRSEAMQVSLTEAAASLNDLVEAAIDGEEVILLVDNLPVAKIMPIEVRKRRPAKAGTAKGLVWMSEDFDEPLVENIPILSVDKAFDAYPIQRIW